MRLSMLLVFITIIGVLLSCGHQETREVSEEEQEGWSLFDDYVDLFPTIYDVGNYKEVCYWQYKVPQDSGPVFILYFDKEGRRVNPFLQLRIGMTRSEVERLVGEPTHIHEEADFCNAGYLGVPCCSIYYDRDGKAVDIEISPWFESEVPPEGVPAESYEKLLKWLYLYPHESRTGAGLRRFDFWNCRGGTVGGVEFVSYFNAESDTPINPFAKISVGMSKEEVRHLVGRESDWFPAEASTPAVSRFRYHWGYYDVTWSSDGPDSRATKVEWREGPLP